MLLFPQLQFWILCICECGQNGAKEWMKNASKLSIQHLILKCCFPQKTYSNKTIRHLTVCVAVRPNGSRMTLDGPKALPGAEVLKERSEANEERNIRKVWLKIRDVRNETKRPKRSEKLSCKSLNKFHFCPDLRNVSSNISKCHICHVMPRFRSIGPF